MNSKTLDFINEHWALLLKPGVSEFAVLIYKTPLQSVLEIMQELSERNPIAFLLCY